ncbi:MAG: mannose-1-phosphate guanylyltransferase [bacterium]|nr:mannose-1-phosphate guanylyltransferase [bacterium]
MLYGVILAGGFGDRFWPKSQPDTPKQLLSITGKKTLLEETLDRIAPLIPKERILIVTNKNIGDKILSMVNILNKDNILVEPGRKNTAPAIALAALYLRKKDKDASFVVLPADHFIPDKEEFLKVLSLAYELAQEKENLITFGIKPTRPETGYGYIETNQKVATKDGIPVYEVRSFKEKPSLDTAREFIARGGYFWNSGIFIWHVQAILDAFSKFMPQLYSGLMKIQDYQDAELEEFYQKVENISIDFGVMEKAKNILMLEGDFTWDDVGSWKALERIYPKDENNNVVLGEHIGIDTQNCIVRGDKKLIATLGISDLIIVDSDEAILICARERAEEVKRIVEKLI